MGQGSRANSITHTLSTFHVQCAKMGRGSHYAYSQGTSQNVATGSLRKVKTTIRSNSPWQTETQDQEGQVAHNVVVIIVR